MDFSLFALVLAIVVAVRVWALPRQVTELEEELTRRKAEQDKLYADLQRLRNELATLREAGSHLPVVPPAPVVAVTPAPEPVAPIILSVVSPPVPVPPPVAPVVAIMPQPEPPAPTPELAKLFPELEKVLAEWSVASPELVSPAPEPVVASSELTVVSLPEPEAQVPEPGVNLPEPAWPAPPPALPAPPRPAPPRPVPPPPRPPRPAPPVRTGPAWWERAATVLLENWTGILGAVILVTGVGFLGIYAALRLAPPYRFLLICGFAGAVLGGRFALRNKEFARQLNAWLLSSAAAIFLFACVGAVSIPGLQWATPPFDYLLLLTGVLANVYLAWRASREAVATLHGVLSLVALAVLPPTAVTLGAAAGVTAFSIAITYRQLWKYQLLLSIASFFAFHLYWHQELTNLGSIPNSLRLAAMGLVTLVGGAAAVVQYRSVYARRRFEPLLFAAHVLNWTCLGINLYLYSTGSVWKTIPLALGALLTFWAGRQARQLGIGWLFQTDTIISLILALATALSLQGWHATPLVIGLFMLLEALLVALIMARQREALVYRVAMAGALLVGAGLLALAASHAAALPPTLYRDALVLALAGWAGLAFVQLIYRQPLLQPAEQSTTATHRHLLSWFAALAGLLQLGAGLVLARLLFTWSVVPVAGLLLGVAGVALALAVWVRSAAVAPNWVRWQQLVLAQLLVVLAILGLHEASVVWSAVLAVLYAENLLVLLLLAGRDEADLLHQRVYRVAVASALLVGAALLLKAVGCLPQGRPPVLYREALLLALAGWGSLAFGQLAFKRPLLRGVRPYRAGEPGPYGLVSNHEAHRSWLGSFAGLGGLLQAGAGGLVARALFSWAGVPVPLLLAALLALAGVAIALATWVRTAAVVSNWVRWQQLILAQLLVWAALFGLHELGLSWPLVWLLLYAESLLTVLLLAGRDEADLIHRGVYRAAAAAAILAGFTLLLLALGHFTGHRAPTLYRDALLLALAGWGSVAAVQLACKKPLLAAVKPYVLPGTAFSIISNYLTHRELLGSFGGLGGLLQVGAGLLLARVLFGWVNPPATGLLLALLGLAGAALGLAAWLQATALAPSWLRRQQLVLSQFFVVLAVLGLHELGLGWPAVLLLLYAENLLVAALLSGRGEDALLHLQTYLLVLQAALLPLLVRYLSPGAPGPTGRATLLLGATLLTVAYQARRLLGRFPEGEYATLRLQDEYRLPLLGVLAGWLLLGASSLVYAQPWAAWGIVGVLSGLLYLRQRAAVPGLWAGLALAAFGYVLLQWRHVAESHQHQTGYVLLYLLPTVAVPVVGLWTSWWPARGRFVRWPWLYLLALHLVVALVAATPAGHVAYVALGLLALTSGAFAATQVWRRALPEAAAVARAGQPDRYLLHLTYALLLAGLLTHLSLLPAAETFFGQPAEYLTAAVFFVVAAAITTGRPPVTEPVYKSWQLLHRWLPEATLLFGTLTLVHNVRAPWLPLLWVSVALVINQVAARLPAHFRRLGVYGRLYYELAAVTASIASVLYVQPGQFLHPDWWALTGAVALLFAYVALALRVGNAPFASLSPAWAALAHPTRRQLEALLLYPAFLALSLLLIQSFDRSVLTVLLMLEVVAVFSTSLLLRRQDLRYVALAGMLGSVVRLVFFDLSRSGTITRAIVFIFMGLLLLGMNALYARFKARFAPDEEVGEEL